MVEEFSAGGVVFKVVSNDILWLVCQHAQHKGWVFPKGLIGDTREGESKEDTSVREVKEETGIDAEILQPDPIAVHYFYTWNGEKRRKTVYYFLMKHVGGNIEEHDHEMSAVDWWTEEQVKKQLTYASDKHAFEEALKLYSRIKNEESRSKDL